MRRRPGPAGRSGFFGRRIERRLTRYHQRRPFPARDGLSPGFIASEDRRGEPRIFISHGTEDQVLAIDRTSRKIVPQLVRAGYDMQYQEFEGSHTVPPDPHGFSGESDGVGCESG